MREKRKRIHPWLWATRGYLEVHFVSVPFCLDDCEHWRVFRLDEASDDFWLWSLWQMMVLQEGSTYQHSQHLKLPTLPNSSLTSTFPDPKKSKNSHGSKVSVGFSLFSFLSFQKVFSTFFNNLYIIYLSFNRSELERSSILDMHFSFLISQFKMTLLARIAQEFCNVLVCICRIIPKEVEVPFWPLLQLPAPAVPASLNSTNLPRIKNRSL